MVVLSQEDMSKVERLDSSVIEELIAANSLDIQYTLTPDGQSLLDYMMEDRSIEEVVSLVANTNQSLTTHNYHQLTIKYNEVIEDLYNIPIIDGEANTNPEITSVLSDWSKILYLVSDRTPEFTIQYQDIIIRWFQYYQAINRRE